ncbi:MAG TPA: phosphate ABC transporter permease PstA, partial [Gammaproteobacteria bacterium]
GDDVVASGDGAWAVFEQRAERVAALRDEIRAIETNEIAAINHALEELRLEQRRHELDGELTPDRLADLERRRTELRERYRHLQQDLEKLYTAINRDSYVMEVQGGQAVALPLAHVVRAYRPNAMDFIGKTGLWFEKLWEFVSDDPREANTEGGVFPAIFGTVVMVLLMSIFVTPFGVIAAVYLKEYARQGAVTRIIRIAVNNLAGVPAIVYGVFGLGFFVYFLGGNLDRLFYPEAAPSPVFGTPGLLWSSLTLALLTLPVVIVATEEGLSRIPRTVREGSYALGATKAETLWRTVLPMASPAMMTGLILAVARAAGEVAPLMLVGVVKLAPSLPIDGNAPFIHLDRKFMHLGFHIYDVGFQSPNVEAARPLVFATAFLLVLVIVVLNLAAVRIRNRLREKYRALEN